MADPIVDRIDALVRSRRSFVAGAASASARPEVGDEEFPVLTDVVDITEISVETPAAPVPLQPMLDALAADLSRAIEERLAAELPELLQAAFEHADQEMRRGMAASIESTTRDFLARRQQLRLPFPDTSPD